MSGIKKKIFLVFLLFSFLFFVTSLITVILWRHTSVVGVGDDNQTFQYQYIYSKHNSSESSYGITTLDQALEVDDFISFRTDDGADVLISNFGTNEYKCYGSCFCEEDVSSKRRSTSVLSRGLVYLVAGITSIVAYDAAKKYFESECVDLLSEECHLSAISSVIDECERYMGKGTGSVTVSEGDPDFLTFTDFLCTGTCMLSSYLADNPQVAYLMQSKCEATKATGKISVESVYDLEMDNLLAQKQFMDKTLRAMCAESTQRIQKEYMKMIKDFMSDEEMKKNIQGMFKESMQKLLGGNKEGGGIGNMIQNLKKQRNICVESEKNYNPSIKCRLVGEGDISLPPPG